MGFASKGYVDGKIRAIEDDLRSLITGGAHNLGGWDASTNTPDITIAGTDGQYYDVIVAGTFKGVTFVVGDKVCYSEKTGSWNRVPTGEITYTDKIKLKNRSTETLSGSPTNQSELNIELVTNIKNIIIFSDDLNTIDSGDIQNRPYYQTADTTARTKGFYVYINGKWEPLGSGGIGTPDNASIEISNNKLALKGYDSALENQMPVKDPTNGLKWVTAVNTETLDQKVQEAANSATQAGTFATQSGNYAAQALTAKDDIENLFKVFDNYKAYTDAIDQGQIKSNTIAFIKQASAVSS